MTLQEKISQMGNIAPGIPRLSVGAYNYWNEACHGILSTVPTTVFPQAVGLSATWDPNLEYQVASAISDEARGLNNLNVKGLTYWAPTINMCRDPRWGRNQESYGEDPFLARQFVVNFIKGMQGNDSTYLKTIATVKHFACNNVESDRAGISSNVDERSLREYYLPVFKAAVVDAHVASVMGAYNALNGIPCCCDTSLLSGILRKEWGFTGYVVSDCGAVEYIYSQHHYASGLPQAAAAACLAGCDLNCGTTYQQYLPSAIQSKLASISEAAIDTAVTRIFKARFLLGEFDPPAAVRYKSISSQAIGSANNQTLSLLSARKSIVLLKNSGLLPFDTSVIRSIAIIGPNASKCSFGGYTGTPAFSVSPLSGILAKLGPSWNKRVKYARGCGITDNKSHAAFDSAIALAKSSDAVIMVMGTDSTYVGESLDLTTLALPGAQEDLIKSIDTANRKVALVLVTGNPAAIPWSQENVPAIVEAWYGGQSQGTAIADVLFGDYNPGGKLTATWFKSDDDLPDMQDYNIFNNRTYMYFPNAPLYPFGFGLSYTTFSFSNLQITPGILSPGKSVSISLLVKNTGKRLGDEVPQLYIHDKNAYDNTSQKQLKGFQRITLAPGASQTVQFSLPYEELAHWDVTSHAFKVTNGTFDVMAGSSSADIKLTGAITAIDNLHTPVIRPISRLPGIHIALETFSISVRGPGFHSAQILSLDGKIIRKFNSTGPAVFTWRPATSGLFLLKLTDNNSTQLQPVLVTK
jgi:beta-glucosidase